MTTRSIESASVQQRRLVRVPDLAAFREAIVGLALEGDLLDIRRRGIVLPSQSAIELLRRTIEDRALMSGQRAIVLPDLLTREDLIARWHASLAAAPPLLTRVAREVLMERAARSAEAVAPPPFKIRAGLIAAILDFYDALRRRGRTVARFAAVLEEELGGTDEADDRGTVELARQTAFLRMTFDEYERAIVSLGAIDEHGVRDRVLTDHAPPALTHLIVAVADHPSDPRGLWPADFVVLGRMATLRRLDVIVTDDAHDAGFRERIDRELPEIEECRMGTPHRLPTLLVPRTEDGSSLCHISRDREEELRDVARAIRASAPRPARLDRGDADAAGDLDRAQREVSGSPSLDPAAREETIAVVFQRPLPYVYLAQHVLTEARVAYQAFDALPLAAEPFAAVLDLVLSFARTGGTRETAVALLASPIFGFKLAGHPVTREDVAALEAVLIERRSSGEADTYLADLERFGAVRSTRHAEANAGAAWAARAAAAIRQELLPFRTGASAFDQVTALSTFIRTHERPVVDDAAAWRDRHVRARAAVLGTLDALAEAYREYDDRPREYEALIATIHQWIERQTFTPRRGTTGVHLVDAVAARFGEFDHLHLVGIVDGEWPERSAPNIFYTSGLLKSLGWPSESEHLLAQQAAFRDLVRSARTTVALSAFQLEGDTIAGVSDVAEEARALPTVMRVVEPTRLFADEWLAVDPVVTDALTPDEAAWLSLRQDRPAATDRAYRGEVGNVPPREYPVSSIDRFVQCPFKYFSEHVLRLGEEVDEESGLSPRERGTLLHRLFEHFYGDWDARGLGGITEETLPAAVAAFERMVALELATLPDADRLLESTRLLGSAVGRGVAERVFQIECAAGQGVTRRLLERSLNGTFEFPTALGGRQRISVRGKADRIDVLDDGSLRVIDYKLTAPPRGKGAVQLPVYSYCAAHMLEADDGQPHAVSAAFYVSFGDDWQVVQELAKPADTANAVIAGVQDFGGKIQAIEDGRFSPKPQSASLCSWCAYALVCRKETVEDDDETAEPV